MRCVEPLLLEYWVGPRDLGPVGSFSPTDLYNELEKSLEGDSDTRAVTIYVQPYQ